jgi:kumamolisin
MMIALAGAAAIALPLATASGAGASAPNPNTPTPVQGGISASALPNATVFGTTPASTPEAVSFIMRANNQAQLEYNATHSQRNFLTTAQFAKTYGANPWTLNALTSYLAKFGITTNVYADGIDVSTTGTAGEYDAALAITQSQYHVPRLQGKNGEHSIPAQTVHANKQAPQLPYQLAHSVLAVLGLTNYAPFTSNTAHVSSTMATPQAGNANACVALTGLNSACHVPSDFTADYGLNSLYQHGASGAGETVAIVTLATVDPDGPEYFWKHIAHVPSAGRLTAINVDGGSGAPSDASGTGETDLDVEQSGSIASSAKIDVFQAPNTDAGFADAFFDVASLNAADSVSASWGESETYLQSSVAAGEETAAYEAAYDEAFEEFAVQGESGFLSAGDSGAYDASGDLGTTNLSVDTSADSPYITSSGGTTLPLSDTLTGPDATSTITVSAQRAWGWDYLWAADAADNGESLLDAAKSDIVGGGGGFSTLEATPSYQQGVSGTHSFSAVKYLTPIDYTTASGILEPTDWTLTPTPGVSRGFGNGRAEPDVSTNADPISGYLLYEPSFAGVSQPTLQGGWGGTSFVAPQLNGAAAVIDSYVGHRVGFWNPAMYSAATGPASPLTPLTTSGTSNDNLYYTGTPGSVYNPATGLGIPNLTALAAHLAAGH